MDYTHIVWSIIQFIKDLLFDLIKICQVQR